MLAPESYEQARKNALLHLQIELDPIDRQIEERELNFPITGKIVRIFRGNQICQLEEFINFDVAVCSPDAPVLMSGIWWLKYSDLLDRKYLEVYLDGKPPNFSVALWQNESIDAPTEQPVMLPTLSERRRL